MPYTYTSAVRDPFSGKTLGVLRSDGACVPKDVTNADWQTFLAWNATAQPPLDTSDGSPTARKKRRLYDIVQDLNALTGTQKTNVANDLFGGAPPKWSQDDGTNAGCLLGLYYDTQTAALVASDKNLAKLFAAALYVQDNPGYLVNPAFDPTVNVAGDAPA